MMRKRDICTIPNLLSLVRLGMIPWIVWMYVVRQSPVGTFLLLTLSCLTDIADGYIARRFHMISDLGKALDPVADKLTQAAVLICLLPRHDALWPLIILMAAKELLTAIMGLLVIRKTGRVYGAQWHGKAVTCCVYGLMALHLLWGGMPLWFSRSAGLLCSGMMLVSLFLYGRRNVQLLKEGK